MRSSAIGLIKFWTATNRTRRIHTKRRMLFGDGLREVNLTAMFQNILGITAQMKNLTRPAQVEGDGMATGLQ
jgi:hypothetical protein